MAAAAYSMPASEHRVSEHHGMEHQHRLQLHTLPDVNRTPMQPGLPQGLQSMNLQGAMQGGMQNSLQGAMHTGMPQSGMPQRSMSDSMQGSLQHVQTGDGLQGMEDSNLSEGVPQEYDNGLALQAVDEEHHMDNHTTSQPQELYGSLHIHDIMPIESARVRLLNLLIDHFVTCHIIPMQEQPPVKQSDKPKKRKLKEVDFKSNFEGDPRYLLPLIYVANMYETFVGEINSRMNEVAGLQGKSMGLALEAAGGLYRRLVEKYPKSGAMTSFKRREMASALEARTKFPSLVTGDEKRVRFIVVHGLEIVERPTTMSPDDAEWFRRITGRHEVCIYPRDYRFFSARTKTRRPANSSPLQQLPSHLQLQGPLPVPGPHQHPQHHQSPHQHQHAPIAASHVARVMHTPGHMGAMIASPSGGPAKFCDECGTPYARDTSKFCSECGMKRPGI